MSAGINNLSGLCRDVFFDGRDDIALAPNIKAAFSVWKICIFYNQIKHDDFLIFDL